MTLILILLLVYSMFGISRIIRDFSQPFLNQPAYVRHPSIFFVLIVFITAPTYWWRELTRPLSKEIKEFIKRIKEKEKLIKKMMW